MDIEKYLSEEEMKDIAIQMYRDKVSLYLKDEDNFKRVLSNAAYDIVYDMVDKDADKELKQFLPEKVKSILQDLSEYNIFKKPDAWSRETNSGYQLLEKALLDNEGVLKERVRTVLESMSNKQYQFLTKDAIKNAIEKKFS